MTREDELWRKNLEAIAKECLDGMDEQIGEGAENESRTIQKLLIESNYGRNAVTVECELGGISAIKLTGEAVQDLVAGNTYSHSEDIDRQTRTATNLLAMGQRYLGRFGEIRVEPFPEGYRSRGVKICFTPKRD